MLALVRQILLWIEELQTFNMVSGIDLWHLALQPVYYLALVSPFLRRISGDGVLPLSLFPGNKVLSNNYKQSIKPATGKERPFLVWANEWVDSGAFALFAAVMRE